MTSYAVGDKMAQARLDHRGWSTGLHEDIVITEHGAERLSGGWDQRWRPMP